LYCLFFFFSLAIVEEEQTIQWLKRRGRDNTMAKEKKKNRQYNGKGEEETIQWLKRRRTDNTMAEEKFVLLFFVLLLFSHFIVSSSLLPFYCLFFSLAIVLFVFLLFSHCIVCSSSLQPLYFLFFSLAIVLSVLLLFSHCIVCSSL
jgi:Flp pilus assembly protein TadB